MEARRSRLLRRPRRRWKPEGRPHHRKSPQYLDHAQQDHALREAVDALPESDRSLIDAFYVEEQTLDEIARSRGVGKNTVQRHHEKLKQALGTENRLGPRFSPKSAPARWSPCSGRWSPCFGRWSPWSGKSACSSRWVLLQVDRHRLQLERQVSLPAHDFSQLQRGFSRGRARPGAASGRVGPAGAPTITKKDQKA
jgi:hypothetical protein